MKELLFDLEIVVWMLADTQDAMWQGNSFSFGMSKAKGAATVVNVGSGIMCGIAPRSGMHLLLPVPHSKSCSCDHNGDVLCRR